MREPVCSPSSRPDPHARATAVAYDLLGNRAEAEEAVQEALARACESIDDLRDPDAAPAWFLRIVTTMCLRTLRRRKLRRALLGWLPGGKGAPEPTAARRRPQSRRAARRHRRAHARRRAEPARRCSSHRNKSSARCSIGSTNCPRSSAPRSCCATATTCRSARSPTMLGVEPATAKTHLVRGLARLRDLMEEHR